jgi:undecaprenyl-diphosphatase
MNTNILLHINSWAGHIRWLDDVMVFCAKDLIYVVFTAGVAALIYLFYKHEKRQVIAVLGALIIAYVLLQIASTFNIDQRPFMHHHLTVLVQHAPGKSFPSDHTTAATAFGVAFLLLTPLKKLGIAFLVCAIVIGFARIFVGIHYPADILGGLIVGTAGVLVVYFGKKLLNKTHTLQSIRVKGAGSENKK